MAMIFPGMDPYLENPALWPGVHSRLIVYIADFIQPQLRPRYLAAVEERIFLAQPPREFIPDVRVQQHRPEAPAGGVAVLERDAPVRVQAVPSEVHEAYVTFLDRHSGQRVVAVLEVLSPTNKYAGPGRDSYLAKQREVLASTAHLIEIDLLRAGPHVLSIPEATARAAAPDYRYLVSVNRAQRIRGEWELYPRRLRERLPRFAVPLADGDDVTLDLGAVLARVYEAGSYADRIDYVQPCVPALGDDDQAWANGQIAAGRGTPA